jgi:hypothetical protein
MIRACPNAELATGRTTGPWPSTWPPFRPRPHLANPTSSRILPVPHSPGFGLATSKTPQTLAAWPVCLPELLAHPHSPAACRAATGSARCAPAPSAALRPVPSNKSRVLLSVRKDCPAVAVARAGPFAILQTPSTCSRDSPPILRQHLLGLLLFRTTRPAPPRPLQRALSSRAHDLRRLHRPRNWRTLETRRQSRQRPPPPRPARQLHPRRLLPLQRPSPVPGRALLPLPLLSGPFDSSSLEGA